MNPSLSGKQFQIGLTMAGAISAGSYTGGVLDFLIQALDEWERARNDDERGTVIPNHRVGIQVMSGASAGAVTAAIGTIAINKGLSPRLFTARSGVQKIQYVLPAVYKAWVESPALVSPNGGQDLLSTEDLGANEPVRSLLNASRLKQILDDALEVQPPPSHAPAPYIADTLHVYMTVTNVRGVPYSISLKGGNYGMMSYGDRRYFRIKGCGTWSAPASQFTAADPGTNLSAATLFGAAGHAPDVTWRDFATASLASAAFPFGLAPVAQNVNVAEYSARQWPIPGIAGEAVSMPSPSPVFPGAGANGTYSFFSIDGGVINNEPFEYAHFALMDNIGQPNRRNGATADRAVIMIDPFPEAPDFPPLGKPDDKLLSILMAILPVLKTQARFKPSELLLAAAEDVFSRFLIAPHRTLQGANQEERYPIACGLLGGFGGFLSQKFRDHDYQLGRRNCQRFLRQSFTLPRDNEIIAAWPQEALESHDYCTLRENGQPYVPEHTIIPLLGSAAEEVELPDWPRLSQAELDALLPHIELRFEAVTARLINTTKSCCRRFLFKVVLAQHKSDLLDAITGFILSDLVRRDQMESWVPPSDWLTPQIDSIAIHAVWAELLNPFFDFFTVPGIASRTKLLPDTVQHVLQLSLNTNGHPFSVWSPSWSGPDNETLYVLSSRKPGLLGQFALTRKITALRHKPSIN